MTLSAVGQIVAGILLLVVGGEALVRGASAVGRRAGLSSLVVGLTIVSLATSAPELAVTLDAVLLGEPDIAVGNVVGSNLANILLVLALAAIFSALTVREGLLRFDLPFLVVLSLAFWVLARDGAIGPIDGALLLAAAIVHVVLSVVRSRRSPEADKTEEPPSYSLPVSLVFIVGGVGLLVVGARLLVAGATEIALGFGVSTLVIGLTVVAVGTSLPELAATVIAVRRGETDLAIGNVVGSNLLNLGVVMGLPGLVAGFIDRSIPVAAAAVAVDIPLMIGAVLVLWAIAYTDHKMVRWEGAILLGLYVAFTGYVLLDAANHDAQDGFSAVMLLLALPMLSIALGLLVVREWRRRRRRVGTQGA